MCCTQWENKFRAEFNVKTWESGAIGGPTPKRQASATHDQTCSHRCSLPTAPDSPLFDHQALIGVTNLLPLFIMTRVLPLRYALL